MIVTHSEAWLELYNLREDLSERHNLAAVRPDKVKELHAQLLAWRKEIRAPLPTPNQDFGQVPAEPPAKPAKKGKRAVGKQQSSPSE